MPSYRQLPTTVYLVKSLEAVNRMHIDRLVRGSPITTMQYVALGVLEARSGLTAAELARRAFVTPQSMQDMVKALETKGLITRTRSAASRRELLISITDLGRQTMADLEPAMAGLDEALVADFSEAEEQMFRALLKRARRNAEEFQPRSPDAL